MATAIRAKPSVIVTWIVILPLSFAVTAAMMIVMAALTTATPPVRMTSGNAVATRSATSLKPMPIALLTASVVIVNVKAERIGLTAAMTVVPRLEIATMVSANRESVGTP